MVSLGRLRGVAMLGFATVVLASPLVAACSSAQGEAPERASLGSVLGVDDGLSSGFNDLRKQSQELVAECMTAAGWEYIPVRYPDFDTGAVASDEDELARIQREGLGHAYAALYAGTDTSASDASWADFVDPNEAYVASLTDAEKAAYDISLYGTEEEQAQTEVTYLQFDPTTGSEFSMTASQSGCQGTSDAAVFDPVSGQTADDAAAIKRFWDELQERAKAEPRSIELDERWARCMRDAGYEYKDADAFTAATYAEFSGRVREVTGSASAVDPTAGWTQEQIDEFFATATPEEVDALYAPSPELTADQRQRLEAILKDEVDVALADYDCAAGLRDEAADIYADVEEQYLLAHEDELAALAASLADRK